MPCPSNFPTWAAPEFRRISGSNPTQKGWIQEEKRDWKFLCISIAARSRWGLGNSSLSLEMEAMAMSKGMMKMVQKPFLFSGLLSTNKSVFFHGCASPLVAFKSRHPNSGILSSPSKSCSTVCKISRKSFIVRASSSSPSTGFFFFSHSILKSRISSYRVIL